MLNVDESHIAVLNDGREIALVLLFEQQLHEPLDHVHFDITSIIARYQDL